MPTPDRLPGGASENEDGQGATKGDVNFYKTVIPGVVVGDEMAKLALDLFNTIQASEDSTLREIELQRAMLRGLTVAETKPSEPKP